MILLKNSTKIIIIMIKIEIEHQIKIIYEIKIETKLINTNYF